MSKKVLNVTREYEAAEAAAGKIDIKRQFGLPDLERLIRSSYVLGFVDGARSKQPSLETSVEPASFGLEINGEAQSVKKCPTCERDFIGGKSDAYCGSTECVLEPG